MREKSENDLSLKHIASDLESSLKEAASKLRSVSFNLDAELQSKISFEDADILSAVFDGPFTFDDYINRVTGIINMIEQHLNYLSQMYATNIPNAIDYLYSHVRSMLLEIDLLINAEDASKVNNPELLQDVHPEQSHLLVLARIGGYESAGTYSITEAVLKSNFISALRIYKGLSDCVQHSAALPAEDDYGYAILTSYLIELAKGIENYDFDVHHFVNDAKHRILLYCEEVELAKAANIGHNSLEREDAGMTDKTKVTENRSHRGKPRKRKYSADSRDKQSNYNWQPGQRGFSPPKPPHDDMQETDRY